MSIYSFLFVQRELKRLDGTTRSPCYTAFRAATVGLSCIRAYGKTELQQTAFIERLDRNAATYFWWLVTSRWFGFWLDFMVFLVVASTTSAAVVMRKTVEPGLVGLALVYVLNLSGLFEVSDNCLSCCVLWWFVCIHTPPLLYF